MITGGESFFLALDITDDTSWLKQSMDHPFIANHRFIAYGAAVFLLSLGGLCSGWLGVLGAGEPRSDGIQRIRSRLRRPPAHRSEISVNNLVSTVSK